MTTSQALLILKSEFKEVFLYELFYYDFLEYY